MTDFTEHLLQDALDREAARSQARQAQDVAEAPAAAQRFRAQLAARPREQARPVVASSTRSIARRTPRVWRGAAAMLAMAASVAFLVNALQAPTLTDETLQARPGARLSATLADGSHVELRGGSRMRVRMPAPRRWWRRWITTETLTEQRLVELSGEAQFEVMHDPRHPFRVVAGGVRIDDIGTVFDVRAYPADSAVRVVVTDGSVSLQADAVRTADAVTLTAGNLATISAAGAVHVEQVTNAAALLSWTGEQLVFRDTPLPQVLRELELTFGRPIVLTAPRVADERITITLDARRLDVALRSLSVLLNLTPQSVGDTLVLSSRPMRP